MYIHIYTFVYTFADLCTDTSTHLQIDIHICRFFHTFTDLCTYLSTFAFTSVIVLTILYTHLQIFVHICKSYYSLSHWNTDTQLFTHICKQFCYNDGPIQIELPLSTTTSVWALGGSFLQKNTSHGRERDGGRHSVLPELFFLSGSKRQSLHLTRKFSQILWSCLLHLFYSLSWQKCIHLH